MQTLIARATPTGVYVVTVKAGDKINGMTAAWVTQVSFKPALVGVAIAPQRHTYSLIKEAGTFCLNALPEGTIELAKHFGFKSGRKVDKFEGIPFTYAQNGSPVLKDAYAYLECKVENEFEAGDHIFFVGSIIDAAELNKDANPLIFKWNDFFGKN
ncbi:Diflavin flavoprotein [Dissulfuribacter thermophilus]|uniref:Diflavin flavoprotein n=1 Tax=Dissulfuribacter thermophilus TaxID=1156395 RepID=A0A1B9F3J9_9BACT|nr:flavin reductase family protein [Dissulfuribacter thermophilus]OCC14506.1 Diflavin flavoprotein [Dissulfuribacter thermophilus]